jgi:hypothetical protein
MNTFVTCFKCGNLFRRAASQTWKRKCVPCWKVSKAQEASLLDQLKRRCADLERQLAERTAAPATPPKTVLRFLMKAAHPDRHDGSEEASTALRWLLDQREQRNNACHF